MASEKIGSFRLPAVFFLAFLAVLNFIILENVFGEGIPQVTIINDPSGSRIQVDGKDFMILGMNWDYVPIGENYSYSLWTKSDDFIEAALAREMPLLKNMGVNTIRHYAGIPPRWVEYIYENYGIYTVINHPLGRYGVTINGAYIPQTDYSDEKSRAVLKAEMEALVDQFKDTPGMLMWLLGNENNYGLTWSSAETEALPEGERQAAKARYLYSFLGEITQMIKEKDPDRLVAMANGDLQYIDIIAEEMKGLDVFGANVYRGISARDAYEVVEEKLGIPLIFTEFGSDAFNAKTMQEDQLMQARYLRGQWQEIYEQSYGKGRVGNACGGFTFQFSDGWWKYRQEINLDVHDINASWPNGGYPEDYVEGENNMNEEWWGICAKGFPDQSGFYELYPRAAYYVLKEAYLLDPYGSSATLAGIRDHFADINLMGSVLDARGDKAANLSEKSRRVSISGVRIEFETISTGGERISTPDSPTGDAEGYPTFRGFDHLQSYYSEIEAKPSENVRGQLTLNYLGHVPENPIDEIFYENRGRVKTVLTDDGTIELNDIERLKVYNASISWEDRWFNVEGFYRTGHYHWGYEGDFFGLYQEANYGPNIDIYNADAPLGMELTGKKDLSGAKMAIGPQLWWGANPAVLLKYRRTFGSITATGVYQEDLEDRRDAVSSIAIPLPKTRKATIHLETQKGPFKIEIGGIWSGDNKADQTYQVVKGESGNYSIFQTRIQSSDAFGGKFKLSYSGGGINWYLQGAAMGLVADGGPTATQTFSGWWLKDSGKGNQRNILTGLSIRFGNLEVAPNFLWQKPIEGPIPGDVPEPGRPRNVLDDPFAVRENRETTAFELIFTYDPTPATWMYTWDSDMREDANFAFTCGIIYKHFPTTMDASIGFLSDGRTTFPFPGATPPRDIWEWYGRYIFKPRPGFGVIANLYAGEGEPNGDDERLIKRYGGDVRLIKGTSKLITSVKLNDWGPYDYHKDFNLTYPLQLSADISHILGTPEWFDLPQTRIGIKATYRTLNEHSPRYCPIRVGGVCDPDAAGVEDGSEWEIRTYLHMNIGM
ncbi:MAG: glycosidase [candidate division Zixibacteria bacterium]|nr:glycosidase [candidate division Zixibacteria bacterium]